MHRLKNNSRIRYLFIGPMRSTSALIDIIEMERQVSNPIELICLKKDEDAYRSALKDTNVEVKSVESYLEEGRTVKQFEEITNTISKIKTAVLDNPARNKIVDRVGFKELFVFYLLAFKGGFTMDTNVHPFFEEKKEDKSKKLELPEENQFCYPWLLSPESWMLFAPSNNKVAFDILMTYLNNWEKAQKPLVNWIGETNYPYEYHLTLQHLSIDAIRDVTKQNRVKELSAWQFIFGSGTTAKLKGINVEKTYGNSHKHPENLAGLIEKFFRNREDSPPEDKDSVESEFSSEILIKISEDFKRQLIDDINCNLANFDKKFGTSFVSGSFLPEMNLRRLLVQKDVNYSSLMNEIKKLKGIDVHKKILFFNTGVDPQKLSLKKMAERIEKNFEERSFAMQVMLSTTIRLKLS